MKKYEKIIYKLKGKDNKYFSQEHALRNAPKTTVPQVQEPASPKTKIKEENTPQIHKSLDHMIMTASKRLFSIPFSSPSAAAFLE